MPNRRLVSRPTPIPIRSGYFSFKEKRRDGRNFRFQIPLLEGLMNQLLSLESLRAYMIILQGEHHPEKQSSSGKANSHRAQSAHHDLIPVQYGEQHG